jgi:prepilin-type N-terminal cleavage/methylation domain-containing protein
MNFKFHLRAGFTLLEIMIALAIVGTVIVAILHTVNYHADVAYEHTLTTRMILFAKEKISEMERNPRNSKGTFPDTEFSFETVIRPFDDQGLMGEESKDTEVVELKTIVRGHGREVELREFAVKNVAPEKK